MPADADTDSFDFYFEGPIDSLELMVRDMNFNEVFPNGTNVYDYGLAPDSNQPCPFDVVDVPPQPSVSDPCNGPGVSNNASWLVPADDDTFSWAVGDGTDVPLGDLEVAIIPPNIAFPDHTTVHEYGVASDSGVTCNYIYPQAPTMTTPSCANPVKTVTPPNQAGVVWLVNGQPRGVTILNPGDSVAYIAEADPNVPGDELGAGAQSNFLYANTFNTASCVTPTPTPTPGPSTACVAARAKAAAAKAKLTTLKKHHASKVKIAKAKKTLAAATHAQNAACA